MGVEYTVHASRASAVQRARGRDRNMLCAGIEHKGSTQQAAGSTHFCRESGGAFYAVRFRGKAWSSQS